MDGGIGGEAYWQYNKTALECYGYMFDKSLATDIAFRIEHQNGRDDKGTEDMGPTIIRAHKFILMSRSPVFCAMVRWSKVLDECKEIVVDDADPEAFYHVIRFMYTDKIDLQPHLVMHVWYLAKKYLLSTLETACLNFLENQLSPTNAAIIYDQSLFFDEKSLAKRCLKIITLKTKECLEAPSFVEIETTTLRNILDLGSTTCEEFEVFNSCHRWARHKCEENNIVATPASMRNMLGDLLEKIRFPTMHLTEFTSFVVPTELLTSAETSLVLEQLKESKPDISSPFLRIDRCYKDGGRIELTNITAGKLQVPGPLASYDLSLELDCTISLHELLLYDSNVIYEDKMPQGKECLQVNISLNGAEIFSDHQNKKESDICRNIKKIPMYGMKLRSGRHDITVKHVWKGKCFHCGNFAQCGSTLGAQFCYNCGNYSGLRPSPMVVCGKSAIVLENNFVAVHIKNAKGNGMPIVGFIFSDPKPD